MKRCTTSCKTNSSTCKNCYIIKPVTQTHGSPLHTSIRDSKFFKYVGRYYPQSRQWFFLLGLWDHFLTKGEWSGYHAGYLFGTNSGQNRYQNRYQHQLGAVSRMTSPNPYWPINVLGTTQCWSIRSLFDRNHQWNGWDRVTRSRGLGVYATWLGLGWGWETGWADAEIVFWSKMHSHNYINVPVDVVITRTGTIS